MRSRWDDRALALASLVLVLSAYALQSGAAYAQVPWAGEVRAILALSLSWFALAAPLVGLCLLELRAGSLRHEPGVTLAALALLSALMIQGCALALAEAGLWPEWLSGASAPVGVAAGLLWIGRDRLSGAEPPPPVVRRAWLVVALALAALVATLALAPSLRPTNPGSALRLGHVALSLGLVFWAALAAPRSAFVLAMFLAASAIDYASILPFGLWAPRGLAGLASGLASLALAFSALRELPRRQAGRTV